jgi:hypothetical protein
LCFVTQNTYARGTCSVSRIRRRIVHCPLENSHDWIFAVAVRPKCLPPVACVIC